MIAKSLQQKVSMTLVLVMIALAIFSYVTMRSIVTPAFEKLELDGATTNLVRAQQAITNDLGNLDTIAGDWGVWDDAHDYATGLHPEFRDRNLDHSTLTSLGLHLLAVFDADSNLIWGQVDHVGQAHSIESLGVFDPGSDEASLLLVHQESDASIAGMLQTALGPMMMSSWPIVRSNGSGPTVGTMLMGQFLDDARIASWREQTEVSMTLNPPDPVPRPGDSEEAAGLHIEETTTQIVASMHLNDLFGVPLLRLDVATPRRVSTLGNSTVKTALVFLGLAAVIIAMLTWWLLRRIIVVPLEQLTLHINSIRASGNLRESFDASTDDEIGVLAGEFNDLTDELHDARKLLLDQSFKAGKADSAAEVLHNIRNALTPLINGIDRVRTNVCAFDNVRVSEALEQIYEADCPPDRMDKLHQYVGSAFDHIEASGKDALRNLDVAAKQARQVEDILTEQEKHAGVSPVLETLSVNEVLEEAVLIVPQDSGSEIDIAVATDIARHSVQAHRVGLLQVMSNLILNACESIERAEGPEKCIDLRASEETVNDQHLVRVTVSDSGSGFDSTTAQKIFQRGFSSKQGHMSGLGLHWCANALAGMGGTIQAESAGPGQGAEFHVILPAAQGGTA